jgi:hypothetical protein
VSEANHPNDVVPGRAKVVNSDARIAGLLKKPRRDAE